MKDKDKIEKTVEAQQGIFIQTLLQVKVGREKRLEQASHALRVFASGRRGYYH